jgi:hypothetical protein
MGFCAAKKIDCAATGSTIVHTWQELGGATDGNSFCAKKGDTCSAVYWLFCPYAASCAHARLITLDAAITPEQLRIAMGKGSDGVCVKEVLLLPQLGGRRDTLYRKRTGRRPSEPPVSSGCRSRWPESSGRWPQRSASPHVELARQETCTEGTHPSIIDLNRYDEASGTWTPLAGTASAPGPLFLKGTATSRW